MRRAWLFRQCWDVHILQLFFVTSSFGSYALWDLPGDVLAAPASALCVLERCNTLSLSQRFVTNPMRLPGVKGKGTGQP